MKLNRQSVTQFLDAFDFQPLFIEELGWDYPMEENYLSIYWILIRNAIE